MKILYVGNSNVIEVVLQDATDDSYLNSATVTMTLKDSSSVDVTGDSWPKTLSYVAASDGLYRATLDESIGITSGERYTGYITAVSGSNTGYWEIPFKAEKRTS